MARKVKHPDVTAHNEGSVVLLELHSDKVREWFEFNVATESWQWMGGNVAVDHRFALDLLDGLTEEGFDVGYRSPSF